MGIILPKTKNYRTFIALLTQAGGTDVQTQTSGSLFIGKTYEITILNAGDDFINVGAPSNTIGIKFIATGTTPQNWTNASELTYNNGAPIANIKFNSIGNVWFEFSSDGNYQFKSNSLFTSYGWFIQPVSNANSGFIVLTDDTANVNFINILTRDSTDININDCFDRTMFEFRVFN